MRRTSRKHAKLLREAKPARDAFKLAHPECMAGIVGVCNGRPVDVHEIQSRARGGSLTDWSNLMHVDRACHSWITTHPKEATSLGFLRSAFDETKLNSKLALPGVAGRFIPDEIDELPW